MRPLTDTIVIVDIVVKTVAYHTILIIDTNKKSYTGIALYSLSDFKGDSFSAA